MPSWQSSHRRPGSQPKRSGFDLKPIKPIPKPGAMKYRGADIEPTGGSYNRFSWSFGPPLSSFGGVAKTLDDAKRIVDAVIEKKKSLRMGLDDDIPQEQIEAYRARFFADFPEAL
jgi:hypothetical protein